MEFHGKDWDGIDDFAPVSLFGAISGCGAMKTVNGYAFYHLGALAMLFAMTDGPPVSTYNPYFLRSLALLDNFFNNQLNRDNLPDAVKRAKALWNFCGSLMEAARHNPQSPMYSDLRMEIVHATNDFQSALKNELERAHIYILEPKRGYSPSVLIGSVTEIIAPATVPYLSYFTQTNLQDAGASLVFDRFTSAGFHTMRAVEDMARKYFELVTGEPSVKEYPSGDRTYVTLGQISWKLTNETLPALRSKKVQTKKLSLIASTLGGLCELYRNPLSHPEIVALDEQEAIDVFIDGISVISKMVDDAVKGGKHFAMPLSAFQTSQSL